MSKSIRQFSDTQLKKELDRREKVGIQNLDIDAADWNIIKNLHKEVLTLDQGINYSITIGGVKCRCLISWEEGASPSLYFDGYTKPVKDNAESRLVEEAIGYFLSGDPWAAEGIKSVKDALKEVQSRIDAVMKETKRLSKKYRVDADKFFSEYIYS